MTKTSCRYPWADVPTGGRFFVPAVAVEKVRREGLIAAMHIDVPAEAAIGIYKKRLGVMFRRVR